jgi:hypothetical protein
MMISGQRLIAGIAATITAVTLAWCSVVRAEDTPDPNAVMQLQFREWVYRGNGVAQLMATVRNPTPISFATMGWDCDLYDRDNRLVGQTALLFTLVIKNSIVVDSFYVSSNGMFQNGKCKLAHATPRTYERLYRPSPNAAILDLSQARGRWFQSDQPVQGQVQIDLATGRWVNLNTTQAIVETEAATPRVKAPEQTQESAADEKPRPMPPGTNIRENVFMSSCPPQKPTLIERRGVTVICK